MNPELIVTADGSHTIYLKDMDEHYHSVNGAINESNHVFIESGFLFSKKKEINILEIGFGTGLNCLLTAKKALETGKIVNYVAIDKYPLLPDVCKKLNYTKLIDNSSELFNEIVSAPWGSTYKINQQFKLSKLEMDLIHENFNDDNSFDLIYFDAFAPSKQPEMWTKDVFGKISIITSLDGIIVTYCSKGEVRRLLAAAGFTMQRLPGPPGKREILRGIKNFIQP